MVDVQSHVQDTEKTINYLSKFNENSKMIKTTKLKKLKNKFVIDNN